MNRTGMIHGTDVRIYCLPVFNFTTRYVQIEFGIYLKGRYILVYIILLEYIL